MIGYIYNKTDKTIVGKLSGVIKIIGNEMYDEKSNCVKPIDGKFDYIFTENDSYTVGDIIDLSQCLDIVKQQKINQLNKDCDNAIISGFYSSVSGEQQLYEFGDKEQGVWNQGLSLLLAGIVETVPVKFIGGTFQPYTKEQYFQLIADAAIHKQSQYMKCDALVAQVQQCKSIEEITNIQW